MLSKDQRLTREECNVVFSQGRRIHTPLFQVLIYPSAQFKAAVVVSKKVAKSAVCRNTVRRRMYTLLGACTQLQNHYMIIVKPALLQASVDEVRHTLGRVLGRPLYSR